ncbi:MAG: sorbosone dehydrogenase family protein [Steroidobacteraceae bacterium]
MPRFPLPIVVLLAVTLGPVDGCTRFGAMRTAPVAPPESGTGPHPTLPVPEHHLIPTMQVATAQGWPAGKRPTAAPNVAVNAFASGLSHPRWLYMLPNGDVLVAETNGPPRPQNNKGLKGYITSKMQAKAGSGAASANRITLLRDVAGDGVAGFRSVFIDKLNSPFGMALIGADLYVANTDAIVKYRYKEGDTTISTPGVKVTDLPGGPINHHWTKNILADRAGNKLYVTVGSNSNITENGIDQEDGRAAIWEVDLRSGSKRIFASGLRNANGMAWEAKTGVLWTVVNERDELGNDLVPDYLTSVKDGAFYGWPYSYYGPHVDTRVQPQNPQRVAEAIAPDFALGSHVAALGLAAAGNTALPPPFANGMFIGEHGSWNRSPPVGYKVVFVPFSDGAPAGKPIDVLSGFISATGEAWGRPVGVLIDSNGAVLVADDVGNTVWRAVAAH